MCLHVNTTAKKPLLIFCILLTLTICSLNFGYAAATEVVDGLVYRSHLEKNIIVSVGENCSDVLKSAASDEYTSVSDEFEQQAVQKTLSAYRKRRHFNAELIQELEENFELFKNQTVSIYLKDADDNVLAMVAITLATYNKNSMPDPQVLASVQMPHVQILPAEKILRALPFARPLNSTGQGLIAEFRYYYLDKSASVKLIADLHFHAIRVFNNISSNVNGLNEKPIVYTYGSPTAIRMYTQHGYKITNEWVGDGGHAKKSNMAHVLVATPQDLATNALSAHHHSIALLDSRHSEIKKQDLLSKMKLNINGRDFDIHRALLAKESFLAGPSDRAQERSYILGFKTNIAVASDSMVDGEILFDRKPGLVVMSEAKSKKLKLYSGLLAREHKLRLKNQKWISLKQKVGVSLYPDGKVEMVTVPLNGLSRAKNPQTIAVGRGLTANALFFYDDGTLAEISLQAPSSQKFEMVFEGRPAIMTLNPDTELTLQFNRQGQLVYIGNSANGIQVQFQDDNSVKSFSASIGKHYEVLLEDLFLADLSQAAPLTESYLLNFDLGFDF